MNEARLIRLLTEGFPRSPRQQNELFGADAELLRFGDDLLAVTIDEFSPEEDLFTCGAPDALGANLAVATLSDLLAVGAEPEFFLQSVVLPHDADDAFAAALARGIRAVLAAAGCSLAGGDVGRAATWRFCGCAIGRVPGGRAVTRVLPTGEHTLWVTGSLGDANVAALSGQATPPFELRLAESRLIRRHGSACVDTSGGLLDAVWQLAAVNGGMGFEVGLGLVPMAPGVAELAAGAGLPEGAALMGGAGEYELLFTTPGAPSARVEDELLAAGATRIGTATPCSNPGVVLVIDGCRRRMGAPPPCAREAATLDAHVQDVVRATHGLLNTDAGGGVR